MTYQTPPSRTPSGHVIEGFVDDFGNIILPYTLPHSTYLNRHNFIKEI